MDDDRSDEDGAGRIVLMAVLLAAAVTLLSFLLGDPSGDGPAVQPLLAAQADSAASPRDEAGRSAATSGPDASR